MSDDHETAYALIGWEVALPTQLPGHIVLSPIFAASQADRRAGKLTRLRLALSCEQARQVARDLMKYAKAQDKAGKARAKAPGKPAPH